MRAVEPAAILRPTGGLTARICRLHYVLMLLLVVGPALALGGPGAIGPVPPAAPEGAAGHPSHGEHPDGENGSNGRHKGALCLACVAFGGPALPGAPAADIPTPAAAGDADIGPAAPAAVPSNAGAKQRCRDPPLPA
ncbi:MAG: hypothetical protein AB7S71_11990 [Dongiaceae bacterium]